jgi:hypothetical protein
MDMIRHPIVFLHLPKTAGQTIHNALCRALGGDHVSPVRVHTQVPPGRSQFPPGHALYSGHLDWDGIDDVPPGRFTFTVLRDPRERMASFYLYMRRDAAALAPGALFLPENIGRRRALEWTADDYFFGGDAAWQSFIRDHYDNFYCSYFSTRRFRGGAAIRALPYSEAVARARHGLAELDGVFDSANLSPLEEALHDRYGFNLRLTDRFDNAGDQPRREPRWPHLLAALGSDSSRRRIDAFAERDIALAHRHASWA